MTEFSTISLSIVGPLCSGLRAPMAARVLPLLPDALRQQVALLLQERAFCAFIGGSVALGSAIALREVGATKLKRTKGAKRTSTSASSSAAAAAAKKKRKKKRAQRGDPHFMRKIKRLLKICIPSLYSKEAALLGAHFSFLVLRTLLTIRAQRLNAQYLTSAIARASWETWAKWIAHFGVWMGIGTVTNIGLKYLETNIAASLRSRLTRHVHRLYCSSSGDGAMALPSFYRANRATAAGGMDDAAKGGIDQVIAADIKEWATNAASFYGHSFQPILEFVLSLRACTASLGTLRPMLLFLTQAVTSVAIRGLLSPPTTKMIVSEREAEGTFRASHARLIAHAESVAFLGGARAEHTLLDATFAKLDRLVRLHALRNMQRSLASNILKFQPLLVGGIFVHVPFLLLKGLDPATRISQFRSTEILMLRCGSAFADCIMLGRNLAELEGHTKRVGELVERLEAMEASGGGRDRRSGGAIGDDDAPLLDLANLTVFAGQNENEKRMLIENLSLTIPRGAHTMVRRMFE